MNNEYWIDSGQTCFKETKEGFYKAINAGFRGFILYPGGKTFWINCCEPVRGDLNFTRNIKLNYKPNKKTKL